MSSTMQRSVASAGAPRPFCSKVAGATLAPIHYLKAIQTSAGKTICERCARKRPRYATPKKLLDRDRRAEQSPSLAGRPQLGQRPLFEADRASRHGGEMSFCCIGFAASRSRFPIVLD